MENLFLAVLGMSSTASVVILLVLLVRLTLRKAPKIFSYALWAVVLLRLLCPLAIQSPWSLTPSIQVEPARENLDMVVIDVERAEVTIRVEDFPVGRLQRADAFAQLPSDVPGVSAPNAPMQAADPVPGVLTAAGMIWLVGAAALLGYSVLSLLGLRRKLVGAVPLAGERNVRLADHISSPFVLGLVFPRIYLPSDLPEGELDYILLHERTHIRRCDHIFRALAWMALAAHWFNPLVWLAFHLAGKDMEMSCDEAVLRQMGRDVRADYSTSLLRLSAGGKLPAGPLAFGGGDPQGRIKNVLSYKKPAVWVVALALAGVLCAGVALATSRTEPPETSGVNLGDLAADLVFSLEEGEDEPYVRMQGSVGDTVLKRGASWHSEAVWGEHPYGELSLVYPAFTDEIEAHLLAWWTDEDRTSVTMSTNITAMLSSQLNVGWWDFTVDLTSGTVTRMTAQPARPIREGLPDEETRMYPQSITDDEAVKAARVAAKLLTAAEDFYANARPDAPLATAEPSVPTVPGVSYSLNVLGNGVTIGGLDCMAAVWRPSMHSEMDARLNLPGEGELGYLSTVNPRFLGGYFANAYGNAIVLYYPEENSPVLAVCFDDYTSSVYDFGFIFFTVDLASEQVKSREISGYSGQAPELSDAEMTDMARMLAGLIQGAADYYSSYSPPVEEGALPFDQPMALWFGSGAGAWRTIMTLHPDGAFEGEFTDSDMGSGAGDYPYGVEYICTFHGKFGDIRQASAGSWSMTLKELTLDTGRSVGEEWISERTLYISSSPYGLDDVDGQPLKPGAQFVFYTPDASGKPGGELYGMENESSNLYGFWTWWPERYAISENGGSTLDCYALRNVEAGYGFFDLGAWGIAPEQLRNY